MANGTIHVQQFGSGWVVDVHSEQDLSTVGDLEAAGVDIPKPHGEVIVDLSEATFIDSSIVGVLVAFSENWSRFAVVAPAGSRPRRVLDLMAFGDMVPVVESRDDAVEAMRQTT